MTSVYSGAQRDKSKLRVSGRGQGDMSQHCQSVKEVEIACWLSTYQSSTTSKQQAGIDHVMIRAVVHTLGGKQNVGNNHADELLPNVRPLN